MIYLSIFIAWVIVNLVILYIISHTLGKRFDKLLQKKGIPYPNSVTFIFPDTWSRAYCYVGFILFFTGPIKEKISFRYRRYRKRFGDFCFRDEATRSEIILSAVQMGAVLLSLLYFIFLAYLAYK